MSGNCRHWDMLLLYFYFFFFVRPFLLPSHISLIFLFRFIYILAAFFLVFRLLYSVDALFHTRSPSALPPPLSPLHLESVGILVVPVWVDPGKGRRFLNLGERVRARDGQEIVELRQVGLGMAS